MQRKIIQIGNSTQLVSLPRKWAVQRNLKKGQEVEIIEKGEDLIIRTKSSPKAESVSIDVSKLNLLVGRYLVAAYRSGYDEVRIQYDRPEILAFLQSLANKILLGFELVSQGEGTCIFRNVSENLSSEFDNVLRRVFFVTSELAKNAYTTVSDGAFERLSEVLALEMTNNRFSLFCERLLNKFGEQTFRKTTYLFLTVYELEKIADHYKAICNHVADERLRKLDKKVLKLFSVINQLFEQYMDLFYSFNKEKAETAAVLHQSIQQMAKRAFDSAPNRQDPIVHELLAAAQTVFHLISIRIELEI